MDLSTLLVQENLLIHLESYFCESDCGTLLMHLDQNMLKDGPVSTCGSKKSLIHLESYFWESVMASWIVPRMLRPGFRF